MNKKLIKFIQVLLIIILAWSLYKTYDYYKDNNSYKALNEEYSAKVAEISEKIKLNYEKGNSEEDMSAMAFVQELQNSYPQVKGRIIIENLDLDFPIVQGEDNSFYLNHDYTGAYHPFGAVFMDARNSKDFDDQNTILYGHNVRSGHVFNSLNKYRDPKYVEENPYIVVDSLQGRLVYKIFAVYDADEYEDYRTPNYDEDKWNELLSRIEEKNLIKGDMPEFGEKILTLSTCSDIDDRMAVQAVLQK